MKMEIVAAEKFKRLLTKKDEVQQITYDGWYQTSKSDPLQKDKKLLDRIMKSTKECHTIIF